MTSPPLRVILGISVIRPVNASDDKLAELAREVCAEAARRLPLASCVELMDWESGGGETW